MRKKRKKFLWESSFLYSNAREYLEKTYYHERRVATVYRAIYFSLNVFTFLMTLAGSILTTLVISRMFWVDVPNWYFFLTASFSAATTFFASIMNFFLIRKTFIEAEQRGIKIREQFLLYQLRQGEYADKEKSDLILFDRIFAIRNEGLFIEDLQRELQNVN